MITRRIFEKGVVLVLFLTIIYYYDAIGQTSKHLSIVKSTLADKSHTVVFGWPTAITE